MDEIIKFSVDCDLNQRHSNWILLKGLAVPTLLSSCVLLKKKKGLVVTALLSSYVLVKKKKGLVVTALLSSWVLVKNKKKGLVVRAFLRSCAEEGVDLPCVFGVMCADEGVDRPFVFEV